MQFGGYTVSRRPGSNQRTALVLQTAFTPSGRLFDNFVSDRRHFPGVHVGISTTSGCGVDVRGVAARRGRPAGGGDRGTGGCVARAVVDAACSWVVNITYIRPTGRVINSVSTSFLYLRCVLHLNSLRVP